MPLLQAIDNPIFYRSALFSGEPRLSRNYLHSIAINFLGGQSNCARNSNKKKVPLLDIYGVQNMKDISLGVSDLSSTNHLDALLIQLPTLSNDPCFGKLSWRGHLNIFEVNFDALCNFDNGFFIRWYSPLRKVSLEGIRYTDLSSPADQQIPEWSNFLRLLTPTMSQYHRSLEPIERSGFDNLSFFLGYTKNYTNTTHLDFIDMTGIAGIVVPTGKQTDHHRVFDIPLGYNNHYGVRLWADCSFGAFDWLTLGAHADVICFIPQWKRMSIKTAPSQQGFIKLAAATVKSMPHPLVTANVFFKADHLIHGFSFLFAYTYTQKFNDRISLCNSSYNTCIANTDKQLQGWNMHTFNAAFEFDFASCRSNGPRIIFSYNHIITGRSIINTDTVQGSFNFDYVWQY
jgi:hypothetical protein